MRWIAIAVLLLSATLFAETQEAAYFRAMQAEEAGDISLAIKNFEEALKIEGPYSDEISEILNEYYDALGIPQNRRLTAHSSDGVELKEESPWSYRFLGELSGSAVHYSASKSDSQWGGLFQGSFSPFVDYAKGDWIHSFGLNLLYDYNVNNDDMPALDTNDWKGTLGVEYSLIGENMLLDVGVDLNIFQKESFKPAFYTWLEYDFYKKNKQRFGAAFWAYYDNAGPMSLVLYGTWRNSATYGLSYSVMAGPRFEVDSVFDYQAYKNAYYAALDEVERQMDEYYYSNYGSNPFDQCLATYGEQCYQWEIATMDSINYVTQYDKLVSEIDIQSTKYWTKWFGPTFKGRVRYKFRNGFSLEARANVFYSFVIDGPDSLYNEISKLTGSLSGTADWNLGMTELYFMVEDVYKLYLPPEDYCDLYPRHTNILKFKFGSKWNF